MRETSTLNRILSLALCLCMVLSLMPGTPLTVNAVYAGSVCAHNHPEASCAVCVAEIQAMVDALPDLKDIDDENRDDVISRLEAIDSRKVKLSDETISQMDFGKYEDAAFVLSAPEGHFGFVLSKVYASGAPETPQASFAFLNAAGEPATVVTAEGAAVTSVSPVPNGEEVRGYLPVGEYTLEESVEGSWNLTLTVNGESDSDLTFTGESGRGYMLAAGNNVTYPIHLEPSEHGSVAVTGDEVFSGDEEIQVGAGSVVTLTVTPDEGYRPEKLTATYVDANGESQTVETTADGTNIYTFTMPDSEVTVTVVFSVCDHEKYVNGFCAQCDAYEPAMEKDGVYEIANAGNLYWFAQQVNAGNNAINGELTADIIVNENVLTLQGDLNGDGSGFRQWTPIGYTYFGPSGSEDHPYAGTFDGSGCRIRGLYLAVTDYSNTKGYAVFGSLSGTVQNLRLVDSYIYSEKGTAGGIVDGNTGLICNCQTNSTVISNGGYAGGIAASNNGTIIDCVNFGCITGSNATGGVVGNNLSTVKNCYNTGTVRADSGSAGGVVGKNNINGTAEDIVVANCYSFGTVTGGNNGGVVGEHALGTVTNCYFNSDAFAGNAIGTGSATVTNTEGKTAAQFKSGEVAYLLGGVWSQTIGDDVYPVLDGETVYKVTGCDGSEVYSNTNENKTHNLVNCVCTVCEMRVHEEAIAYENGFCPNGCYESAVLNGEWYEIGSAGQLYWFAQQVNSGNRDINGKLMNNIVVNENVLKADGSLNEGDFRPWIMIGCTDEYLTGDFDGQGFRISGLYYVCQSEEDYGSAGFIHSIIGGTVSNLELVDSYIKGNGHTGGVVGFLKNGTVENCRNGATVESKLNACGIVGSGAGNSTVSNCFNTGNPTAISIAVGHLMQAKEKSMSL